MSKETTTLTITSASELTDIIAKIKENFAKEVNEQDSIVIKFDDSISKDDLLESLKQLWQYEIDDNHTIDILIKNLSYDHRKSALGLALKTPQLKNPIFLMNVFCLVKGFNTFDEAYFNHEQVFLNDEVEFLDIFDDLEAEIKEVTYKLAEYYISMLKTCHLVEAVENNPNAVEIENMYTYLFDSVDVTIMARILSLVKDPLIWETKKIVINSLGYLGMIAEKFVFTNSMMNLIGQAIMEKSIKESLNDEKQDE